ANLKSQDARHSRLPSPLRSAGGAPLGRMGGFEVRFDLRHLHARPRQRPAPAPSLQVFRRGQDDEATDGGRDNRRVLGDRRGFIHSLRFSSFSRLTIFPLGILQPAASLCPPPLPPYLSASLPTTRPR